MQTIDWTKAFEVFGIGFGGVFFCLFLLLCSIKIYSLLVRFMEAAGKNGEPEKTKQG